MPLFRVCLVDQLPVSAIKETGHRSRQPDKLLAVNDALYVFPNALLLINYDQPPVSTPHQPFLHQFSENCTVIPELIVVIGNDCEVFGTVLR